MEFYLFFFVCVCGTMEFEPQGFACKRVLLEPHHFVLVILVVPGLHNLFPKSGHMCLLSHLRLQKP
jgi:hypothetical protein